MATRWSDDAFLDEIRRHVDPEADACVARVFAEGAAAGSAALFRHTTSNDDRLPEGSPPALVEFFQATRPLPPGADPARLARGEFVWMKNAFPAALVLLAKSLPEGYAAPSFGQVLSFSGDLERHPYRRLLGVLQMVVNVSSPGGFAENGKAVNTAQKMRLMHAAIRSLVLRRMKPPFDAARLGPPVNLEDMLATIMGFSWLLIDGVRRLDLPLGDQEAEDLYYLWRVFALLMGIHPPGKPHDDSLIPATIAEADTFYASYVRRNDTTAERNPYGVVLTQANLTMMTAMIWWPLKSRTRMSSLPARSAATLG